MNKQLTKEEIVETIATVTAHLNKLHEAGIPYVFAAAGENVGVHILSSVPLLETPIFLCDVIRHIQMYEQEKAEKEANENPQTKVVSMMPVGEA